MALFQNGGGFHFKEPWLFMPAAHAVADLQIDNAAGSAPASSTTAFFTEMALRGFQDTTNWTADTYKTLLNVSSGKGLLAALVGPTAGGASTTTFEITADGVLTEIAIVVASGERANLNSGLATSSVFTSAGVWNTPGVEALKADKATFVGKAGTLPLWSWLKMSGTPLLRFNQSLLIRAKHSASITNSTATAYSGGMYRLGL